MTSAATPDAARASGTDAAVWRGRAFGLPLESDFRVPHATAGWGPTRGRPTRLELTSAQELNRIWPADAKPVFTRRYTDGTPIFSVETAPGLGYRVAAPRHGRHVVSPDGTWIRSALPRVPDWRWERLLFAQVLPLAAVLRGLAVFHASAVAIHGRVLAFSAESGTGKTSLAANLVALGASFVTDDVLAVAPVGPSVAAHPGAALANLHPLEWRALGKIGQGRVGRVVGRSEKVLVATAPVPEPLDLAAFYVLERSNGSQIRFETLDAADPRVLLTKSFLSYVPERAYLTSHLDACAAIAVSAAVVRVRFPQNGGDAATLARAVNLHALETVT